MRKSLNNFKKNLKMAKFEQGPSKQRVQMLCIASLPTTRWNVLRVFDFRIFSRKNQSSTGPQRHANSICQNTDFFTAWWDYFEIFCQVSEQSNDAFKF